MLLKALLWRQTNFFWKYRRNLGKSLFLADLSVSQYLLDISQTPLTVENSENLVKS